MQPQMPYPAYHPLYPPRTGVNSARYSRITLFTRTKRLENQRALSLNYSLLDAKIDLLLTSMGKQRELDEIEAKFKAP